MSGCGRMLVFEPLRVEEREGETTTKTRPGLSSVLGNNLIWMPDLTIPTLAQPIISHKENRKEGRKDTTSLGQSRREYREQHGQKFVPPYALITR